MKTPFWRRAFAEVKSNLPPLLPKKIQKEMNELEKEIIELDFVQAEKKAFAFLRRIWPWRRAFAEVKKKTADLVGKDFFLSFLPARHEEKARLYIQCGGDALDVFAGGGYLSTVSDHDEALQLRKSVVEALREIEKFARQKICTTEESTYRKRVVELEERVARLEDKIRELEDKNLEHWRNINELLASGAEVRDFGI